MKKKTQAKPSSFRLENKKVYNKNYIRVGGQQGEMEYPSYWFRKII